MNLFEQEVTLWKQTGFNPYGETVFSAPVDMLVRWENHQELFHDLVGREKMSHTAIFLSFEETEIVNVGDYMYLGKTTDTDPMAKDDAYEVQKVVVIPDLRLLRYFKKIFL